MTRVLYINTKFQGGGAERVARQLYEKIGTEGVESRMIVGKEDHAGSDYQIIYENLLARRSCLLWGCSPPEGMLVERRRAGGGDSRVFSYSATWVGIRGAAAWSCASRVASACSDRGPGAPETLQV